MIATTVASVGARARELAEQLAIDDHIAWTAAADSFLQLLVNTKFPTAFVVFDELEDTERTRASIELAHTLGSRVVLVAHDRNSASRPWCADLVVTDHCDPALVRALNESSAAPPHVPRPAQTPSCTDRERQALLLWERYGEIAILAEQMKVTHATASTFLWRARRKLIAGAR